MCACTQLAACVGPGKQAREGGSSMQFPVRRPTNGLAPWGVSVIVVSALVLSIGGVANARPNNHRHGHHGGSVTGRHPKHHGPGGTHHGGGAPSINGSAWGKANGTNVDLYTLTNGAMKVTITNYGGVVQSIFVPDRRGRLVNVALGFPRLSDYVADFTQGATQKPWPESGGSGDTYFGAIIGRYANRIADHSFTLSGKPYTLDANNGKN